MIYDKNNHFEGIIGQCTTESLVIVIAALFLAWAFKNSMEQKAGVSKMHLLD